jgi:hypothetical protein
MAGAVAAVALAAAACGTVGPGDNVTETFSDTLQPFIGDFKEHPFNVGKNGEYSVRIGALDPAVNLFLVVYFGVPSDAGCQIIQQNLIATPGREALSGEIRKGLWCVGIADRGTLTQAETYKLEVSHP